MYNVVPSCWRPSIWNSGNLFCWALHATAPALRQTRSGMGRCHIFQLPGALTLLGETASVDCVDTIGASSGGRA
eukprot:363570-Chlamydomonas_euryale.AAC.10